MPTLLSLRAGDPAMLAGYRLVGRLGEGGQGSVFLGEGAGGARVAVKILHARLGSDPAARQRFAREVKAAERVAPFCTARVLAADIEGETPYLISEYIDGPSLQEFIRSAGPMDGVGLRQLAIGTLTALTAVHRAGIVHRDFKPGNVLLSSAGPRVVDFGISRALDATGTLTGQAIGTPPYMAPEQVELGSPGPAMDMFAWGCTMVYAATGAPPFGNDTMPAVIARVLHGEPNLGGLPEPLRGMVAACLEKDPSMRPGTEDLLRRLLGNGNGEQPVTLADAAQVAAGPAVLPPHAYPQPHHYPHSRPTDPVGAPPTEPAARLSRRGLLICAGAVALAGTGAVTAALWGGDDDDGDRGTRQPAGGPTRDGRVLWSYAIPGDRVDELIASAHGIFFLSSKRIYALNPATGRQMWTMDLATGPLMLSAGGTLFAGRIDAGGSDQVLQAIDVSLGRRRWSKRLTVFTSAAIGPENIVLVGDLDGKKHINALHVGSGRRQWSHELPVPPGAAGTPEVLAVSPKVTIATVGSTVIGFATGTGVRLWTFPLGGSVLGRGAVAGDAVFIGYDDANKPAAFYSLNASTGKQRWKSPLGGSVSDGPRSAYLDGSVSLDPTGVTPTTVYLISGGDGALHALDSRTGEQRWTFRPEALSDCWGPIGGLIYATTLSKDILYAQDATTGKTAWIYRTDRVWKVAATGTTAYVVANGDANDYRQTLYALRAAH